MMAADDLQLLFLGDFRQARSAAFVFGPLFAHFVAVSFSVFVVFMVSWQTSIYYIRKEKTTTKCAFFIHNR